MLPKSTGEPCHLQEEILALLQHLAVTAVFQQQLQPQVVAHDGIGWIDLRVYGFCIATGAEGGTQQLP